MTDRSFRFGVNLVTVADRDDWAATCRSAEDAGYDVLAVPDHLGAPEAIAAKYRALRAEHGVDYLTVLQPALEAFAPVIPLLR